MSRVIVLSKIAAFVAFLFFAIPAQADEIEPEPEPAPMDEPMDEPEPEPKPVIPAIPKGDDYARTGIYVGANFAGAWYPEVKDDVDDAIEPPPPALVDLYDQCKPQKCFGGTIDTENPLGFGAQVGYRFHPHLAGEVELQWFSKAKTDHTYGSGVNKNTVTIIRVETLTLTGNVKGYLLTGRIQPFLLAGAGLMHFNAKDKFDFGIIKNKGDGFAARFGAGIDFYLNKNIVAVLQGGYVLPVGPADGLDFVSWSAGLQYRF